MHKNIQMKGKRVDVKKALSKNEIQMQQRGRMGGMGGMGRGGGGNGPWAGGRNDNWGNNQSGGWGGEQKLSLLEFRALSLEVVVAVAFSIISV